MSQQIPRLLFVGAGNIAQSIIKGIIKAKPTAGTQILATAPSLKNLNFVKSTLGCETTLLADITTSIDQFKPDYVLLCVKPQVLLSSATAKSEDMLAHLLRLVSNRCTTLSLLAGVKHEHISTAFNIPREKLVRVMLNTAAEIGSTSVFYYAQPETSQQNCETMERLFSIIGQSVIKLNNEDLMDTATGVCGSGIAFYYEIIQTISDIGVKNGLNRSDATMVAAQLSKSAGEMLLQKKTHPYQLRDDVTSPAGTTIYGLSSWHENSINQKIGHAFQAAIDRAKELSDVAAKKFESNIE